MEVVTVHYNTPEMMDAMIRSINKHTEGIHITVFDNSDSRPFVNTFDNVEVIDNTQGQVIDFEEWLQQYPERNPRKSNYGSPKHCKSVDICFDMFPDGFILADSDILVKKDISELWDEKYGWVGEVYYDNPDGFVVPRVLPFLCYINVPKMREKGIRYFNHEWIWHLIAKDPNRWYDTGAWFYKTCTENGIRGRQIVVSDYCEHYFHGSHGKYNGGLLYFIEKFKELWK